MININQNKKTLGLLATTIVTMALLMIINTSSPEINLPKTLRVLTEEESNKIKNEICGLLDDEVKDGKLVSKEQEENWKSYSDTMASRRGNKNYMEAYMAGDPDGLTEFGINLAIQCAPYIVFFVLSILGFIMYCCCCTCEKCCPPCKLCGCCKTTEPYVGFAKYWPAGGSLLFLFTLFIVCIVGLVFSGGLQNAFNVFLCGGQIAFHGVIYGGGSFDGTQYLFDEMQKWIDNDLGGIQASTVSTFAGNNAWSTIEKQEMDDISTSMKGVCASLSDCGQCDGPDYGSATPPDPFDLKLAGDASSLTWATGQACAGMTWTANARTDFDYAASPLSTGSGAPSLFFGTVWETQVDGAIALYSATVTAISTAVQVAEASGKGVADNFGQLRQTFSDGLKAINVFGDASLAFMISIRDFHAQYYPNVQHFTSGLLAVFSLFLIFSIIGIVFTIFIYWKNFYKVRLFLHVCWICFGFIMILTFAFTFLLSFISVGGEQFCEILDGLLHDKVYFDKYSAQIAEDLKEKIVICKRQLNLEDGPYKGDDDITVAFGIKDSLLQVLSLKDIAKDFLANAGPESEMAQALQDLPNQIDSLLDNLETLRNTHAFQGIVDHTELNTALAAIDTAEAACGSGTVADKLVAKQSDCGATPYALFSDNPTVSSCFLISDTTYTNRWLAAGSYQCDDSEAERVTIIDWRDEKAEMIDLRADQTTALKNQLRYYVALWGKYNEDIVAYNDSISDALDVIAHPTEGLLNNVHCFWFGDQLDNFYDATCVAFIASCYELWQAMAWFSFTMYFACFFLFMSARRMAYNQKFEAEKQQKVGEAGAAGENAGELPPEEGALVNEDVKMTEQQA